MKFLDHSRPLSIVEIDQSSIPAIAIATIAAIVCGSASIRSLRSLSSFFLAIAAMIRKPTLGARGFLRGEPRSAISEALRGEERENRQEVRKPLVAHDS